MSDEEIVLISSVRSYSEHLLAPKNIFKKMLGQLAADTISEPPLIFTLIIVLGLK